MSAGLSCHHCGKPLAWVAETRQRDGYIMRTRLCDDGHRNETWEMMATVARRAIPHIKFVLTQHERGVEIRCRHARAYEATKVLLATKPRGMGREEMAAKIGVSERQLRRMISAINAEKRKETTP